VIRRVVFGVRRTLKNSEEKLLDRAMTYRLESCQIHLRAWKTGSTALVSKGGA
jgi:hypothetical protein